MKDRTPDREKHDGEDPGEKKQDKVEKDKRLGSKDDEVDKRVQETFPASDTPAW